MKHGSTSLLVLAIALLASAAPADGPQPSASPPASSASAAPSSTAAALAAAPAPLAPLGPMVDWPDTTSPKPKPEEWDAAVAVRLERPSEGCTTSRVREWIRVSCRFGAEPLIAVRVIGGPTEGVEISDRKPAPGQPTVSEWHDRIAHGVNVIFAVRRGDRRVFEIVGVLFEGRYSLGEDAAAMISALWLPGDPGPTIVID